MGRWSLFEVNEVQAIQESLALSSILSRNQEDHQEPERIAKLSQNLRLP
jgi:hypothetical protein